MTFEISPRIALAYPDLRIGVVVASGIVNSGQDAELTSITERCTAEFRKLHTTEDILEHTNVVAWRNTYRSFGVNPKKHVPTAEAFCRRIAKGGAFPWISRAVNSYLLAELEFLLPFGGYDLDLIDGGITLRYSPGGEAFTPLGADPGSAAEVTQADEIVYADSTRVLTRSWNRKDAECAKITEAACATIPEADVIAAVERTREYLIRFCGGTVRVATIESAKQTTLEL